MEEHTLEWSNFRGINLFAALAITSVVPFTHFARWPLSKKLQNFGQVVGVLRMVSIPPCSCLL